MAESKVAKPRLPRPASSSSLRQPTDYASGDTGTDTSSIAGTTAVTMMRTPPRTSNGSNRAATGAATSKVPQSGRMYGAASTAAPSRVIRASSGDSNGIAATSTSQMPPPGATARRAVGGGKGHARASSLGSISGVGSTARSQRTLLSAGAAAAKRQMPVSTASKKAAADDAARETMRALGLAPGSGTLLRSRVEEEDVTAPLSPQAGTETDASSTGEIRRSQASSSHASPPSARASRRDQNAAPPRATPPRKVSSQASPASSASKTQTGKGATRTGSSGRPSAVAAAAATAAADLELIRLRSQVSAQEDELTQLRARCHELEEDERAARTASPPKATFGGQVVTAKEMDKLSRDFAEQEKLITAYQRESEKHMVAIADLRKRDTAFRTVLTRLYGTSWEDQLDFHIHGRGASNSFPLPSPTSAPGAVFTPAHRRLLSNVSAAPADPPFGVHSPTAPTATSTDASMVHPDDSIIIASSAHDDVSMLRDTVPPTALRQTHHSAANGDIANRADLAATDTMQVLVQHLSEVKALFAAQVERDQSLQRALADRDAAVAGLEDELRALSPAATSDRVHGLHHA